MHYRGRYSAPGYHCAGKNIVNGRGEYCLNVGGVQIDAAVADAFLEAVAPAAWPRPRQSSGSKPITTPRSRSGGSKSSAPVTRRERAERRYRAVDPDNRLVARGLEAEWENAAAGAEGRRSGTLAPGTAATAYLHATSARRCWRSARICKDVWTAPTTTDRDRKELLRTLLEEVILSVERGSVRASDAALARRARSPEWTSRCRARTRPSHR